MHDQSQLSSLQDSGGPWKLLEVGLGGDLSTQHTCAHTSKLGSESGLGGLGGDGGWRRMSRTRRAKEA